MHSKCNRIKQLRFPWTVREFFPFMSFVCSKQLINKICALVLKL